MSVHHTLFSIMYTSFCKVVLDNNKIVCLFYALEDLSADASHDQLESTFNSVLPIAGFFFLASSRHHPL